MEGTESNQSVQENQHGVKRTKLEVSETDRLLNFTTAAEEFELSLKRHKLPRDPMSHRIIEKRRRDRMNNCLADLSRLIPSSYHKQGQGRIEKTEIIEMAIKHINLLQQRLDDAEKKVPKEDKNLGHSSPAGEHQCCANKFYMGFKEAQDEVMRFLVEVESINAMDPFCKKIMHHLENASKKFIKETISRCFLPDVEKSDATVMASQSHYLSRSAFFPSSSGGSVMSGDNSSSMDNKERDQHLCSLLARDKQRSAPGSNNGGSGNNSESSSGSNGTVPLFSYSNHLNGLGPSSDQNGVGSSGYVSDLSNMDKQSPSGSTSSRDNVYKFKHNITKRFSQEGHHHHLHHHHHHHVQHHHHKHGGQPSDTSSSTSSRDLEDDQNQLKWVSNKHKARHTAPGSRFQDESEGQSGGNHSANSDECNSESVSNEGDRRRNNSKVGVSNLNHPGENNSSVALPGFILHPQGTHYMPISVHNTNIAGLFENNADHDGPMVFHPISIPVHFRRPVISMPNITICTHMSSQRRSERSGKD